MVIFLLRSPFEKTKLRLHSLAASKFDEVTRRKLLDLKFLITCPLKKRKRLKPLFVARKLLFNDQKLVPKLKPETFDSRCELLDAHLFRAA